MIVTDIEAARNELFPGRGLPFLRRRATLASRKRKICLGGEGSAVRSPYRLFFPQIRDRQRLAGKGGHRATALTLLDANLSLPFSPRLRRARGRARRAHEKLPGDGFFSPFRTVTRLNCTGAGRQGAAIMKIPPPFFLLKSVAARRVKKQGSST